jgi:glycosyltransferase involved in cell wall biosynthesis
MSGWINDTYQKGLVSVIIPTYNRSAFLQEALQSVWRQTYRPLECIVVDDGSTDDTSQVLHKFAMLQDNSITLRIIYQDNAGAQVSRNKGTIASTGEYIQYLDSDDLLYPGKMAAQVDYLVNNSRCDCVFGNWQKGLIQKPELVVAYKADNFIKQIVTLERPIVNFSFLMRRSLARKAGQWDTSLKRMQEIDFQLKAVTAGGNFCYQPFLCGLWRHHPGERIYNQTTVIDMLPFFQKWEYILSRQRLFDREMGERISGWYMWFISQSKRQRVSILLPVVEEAVRLQPSIAFYSTKKMKLLQQLLGRRRALYLWLLRYRKT